MEGYRRNDINEREREVFLGIIEGYFETASPVGSKFVSESCNLNLSPASIRNIMVSLEEEGYIYQPHLSAGRVPTAKGYGFYVEGMMKAEKISHKQKEIIKKRFSSAGGSLSDTLNRTSRSLSDLSHYAGVVLAPDTVGVYLLHIQFIKIKSNNILVIIVFKNGVTENRSIYIDKDVEQKELKGYSDKLNCILEKKNCSIDNLRDVIIDEIHDDRDNFYSIINNAVFCSVDTDNTESNYDNCLYVGPEGYLLEEPEFSDNEQIKFLIKTISDKKTVIKLLGLTKNCKTKRIFIGSDEEWSEITGLSLVSAPYVGKNNMLKGSIGIIGPLRMNYSLVIPVIDFMAELLSEII